MIKVTDVAYARFRAPDLDKMEGFLKDFGLERSARTDNALYMRACGTSQCKGTNNCTVIKTRKIHYIK